MTNNVKYAIDSFLSANTSEDVACTSPRDWHTLADDWGKTTFEKIAIVKELEEIATKYADKYLMNDNSLDNKTKKELLLNSISTVIKIVKEDCIERNLIEDIVYKFEMLSVNIKQNHKFRDSILETLKMSKYNLHCRLNEYPYFVFFLIQIYHIEIVYLRDISNKEDNLRSILTAFSSLGKDINCISDTELNKYLHLYKSIKESGSKNKYINTTVADRWCIDIDKIANILRKLFNLSKHSIK